MNASQIPNDPLESSPKHHALRLKEAGEFVFELLKIVLISLAIIIPVRHFLIQPFYVKGASMEPNFQDHEYLVVDEISYRFHEPARGEIIVFRAPGEKKLFFIKRIIGVPGETVELRGGKVYIKGALLSELNYLSKVVLTLGENKITLKDNEYWVMGDNRMTSLDSRSFGPIKRDQIVGRAIFLLAIY